MSSILRKEIETLRKEKHNGALLTVAMMYICLLIGFLGFAFLPLYTWAILIPFMGLVQYYIVISGHEAVHKTLCANMQLNEFFGVFGQALVGVNFHAYRLQHLDHHRCASSETDPDSHIYMKVMAIRSGWPRFFYLVFGTLIEILIKIRQKGTGGYGTERKINPKIERLMKRDSVFVILAQLSLMGIANICVGGLPFSLGLPWAIEAILGCVVGYAIVWIVPLFCVTVFLNRCRIVIEHGLALHIANQTQDFGGPRIPTIDVVPNVIERIIFAPFLFNYHCAHHLFMAVPHYNLPKLHALLRESQHAGHHRIDGGYVAAIRRTMSVD